MGAGKQQSTLPPPPSVQYQRRKERTVILKARINGSMMAMQEVFITIESQDEVNNHCKPGAGADTCKYLVMSPNGFRCEFQNMNFLMSLSMRDKPMVAQREGCDRVNTWFRNFTFDLDALGTTHDVPSLDDPPTPKEESYSSKLNVDYLH